MNCYEVLGIEETYEIKRIKKAYAAKSRQWHPEDHPEEFQVLHAAYEEALGRAKWRKAKEEEAGESGEVEEVPEAPGAQEECSEWEEANPFHAASGEAENEENPCGQWKEQFERIAEDGGRNAGINWMVRRLMEEFHLLYMDEEARSKLYRWRDYFDEPFDPPQMAQVFASREFVEAWYHFLGSHHIFTTQIWQYFASVDGYRFNSEQYGIPRFPYHLYIEQVQSLERAVGWEQKEDTDQPEVGRDARHQQSSTDCPEENNPPVRGAEEWANQKNPGAYSAQSEGANAAEQRTIKKAGKKTGRKVPRPVKALLYVAGVVAATVGSTILGVIVGLIFG